MKLNGFTGEVFGFRKLKFNFERKLSLMKMALCEMSKEESQKWGDVARIRVIDSAFAIAIEVFEKEASEKMEKVKKEAEELMEKVNKEYKKRCRKLRLSIWKINEKLMRNGEAKFLHYGQCRDLR